MWRRGRQSSVSRSFSAAISMMFGRRSMTLASSPLPLDGAPHRCRPRTFRDPALEPPDQLGSLVLVEQAADRRIWHKGRAGFVELVRIHSTADTHIPHECASITPNPGG